MAALGHQRVPLEFETPDMTPVLHKRLAHSSMPSSRTAIAIANTMSLTIVPWSASHMAPGLWSQIQLRFDIEWTLTGSVAFAGGL